MIKRIASLGLLASLALGSAWAQTSEFASFRAPLSSASEVPPVEDEDVSGSVLVLIQTTRNSEQELTRATVGFYVDLDSADSATITAMHIHEGSSSENGSVVIDSQFGSSADVEAGASQLFRQVTITSEEDLDVISQIMSGPSGFYVNVHSMDNPAGVARGQLEAVSFDDATGDTGPSHDELSSQLDNMQETLSRVARRLGVVPASEDGIPIDEQ